jgi:hypothetical protein
VTNNISSNKHEEEGIKHRSRKQGKRGSIRCRERRLNCHPA